MYSQINFEENQVYRQMKNWIKMQVTDRQIVLGVYKWDFKCRYRLADMQTKYTNQQMIIHIYENIHMFLQIDKQTG